jgi:hypothetical protein
MNSPSQQHNFPLRWFRWVAAAILFTSALIPVFGFGHMNGVTLFLMIVLIVCLFAPIAGGILGLISNLILGIYYSWDVHGGTNIFSSPFLVLLIVGSTLSIIYGIARWWWRKKQSK